MKNLKIYVILHVLLAGFSLSPVCIKLAGQHPFLSWPFILLFGTSIFILGVYALGWQQIIKRMPLTAAYANKAVTVVWGLVWGVMLFNEVVTVQKPIGAGIIIVGILLYAIPSKEEKALEAAAQVAEGVGPVAEQEGSDGYD